MESLAETVVPAISASKARRLRAKAVKRRLWHASANLDRSNDAAKSMSAAAKPFQPLDSELRNAVAFELLCIIRSTSAYPWLPEAMFPQTYPDWSAYASCGVQAASNEKMHDDEGVREAADSDESLQEGRESEIVEAEQEEVAQQMMAGCSPEAAFEACPDDSELRQTIARMITTRAFHSQLTERQEALMTKIVESAAVQRASRAAGVTAIKYVYDIAKDIVHDQGAGDQRLSKDHSATLAVAAASSTPTEPSH
eukprot:TRINITY_DN18548_c1_g1_i1.p1 TRINITY_DN18548_c1_g1~~TRINITY_DN18548_c1_g1_i1.p1  ORF type:complete len:254 (-),score=46.07 TRINITY_DN18548_c1_g1_i1:202-963(-)